MVFRFSVEVSEKTIKLSIGDNFIAAHIEKDIIITKIIDEKFPDYDSVIPKENTKIAIATFIENGYGGARWAAPISSLMIEKYLYNFIDRRNLEKRMLNGSLENEYNKPLSGVNFNINE